MPNREHNLEGRFRKWTMDQNREQTPKSYRPWELDQKMTSSQMVSLEDYRTVGHIIIRNISESTADNLQMAG